MNESSLLLITFILYILSAFFYLFFLLSKKENLAKRRFGIAFLGLLIHTLALVARTFESGHAPFANMYESISFLAWSSILAFIIIEGKYKISEAGPYFILIVLALMAIASSPLMPKEATPLLLTMAAVPVYIN